MTEESDKELQALVALVKAEDNSVESMIKLIKYLNRKADESPKKPPRRLIEIADEWRRDKFFESFPDAVNTHPTWRMVKEYIDLEDRYNAERDKLHKENEAIREKYGL